MHATNGNGAIVSSILGPLGQLLGGQQPGVDPNQLLVQLGQAIQQGKLSLNQVFNALSQLSPQLHDAVQARVGADLAARSQFEKDNAGVSPESVIANAIPAGSAAATMMGAFHDASALPTSPGSGFTGAPAPAVSALPGAQRQPDIMGLIQSLLSGGAAAGSSGAAQAAAGGSGGLSQLVSGVANALGGSGSGLPAVASALGGGGGGLSDIAAMLIPDVDGYAARQAAGHNKLMHSLNGNTEPANADLVRSGGRGPGVGELLTALLARLNNSEPAAADSAAASQPPPPVFGDELNELLRRLAGPVSAAVRERSNNGVAQAVVAGLGGADPTGYIARRAALPEVVQPLVMLVHDGDDVTVGPEALWLISDPAMPRVVKTHRGMVRLVASATARVTLHFTDAVNTADLPSVRRTSSNWTVRGGEVVGRTGRGTKYELHDGQSMDLQWGKLRGGVLAFKGGDEKEATAAAASSSQSGDAEYGKYVTALRSIITPTQIAPQMRSLWSVRQVDRTGLQDFRPCGPVDMLREYDAVVLRAFNENGPGAWRVFRHEFGIAHMVAVREELRWVPAAALAELMAGMNSGNYLQRPTAALLQIPSEAAGADVIDQNPESGPGAAEVMQHLIARAVAFRSSGLGVDAVCPFRLSNANLTAQLFAGDYAYQSLADAWRVAGVGINDARTLRWMPGNVYAQMVQGGTGQDPAIAAWGSNVVYVPVTADMDVHEIRLMVQICVWANTWHMPVLGNSSTWIQGNPPEATIYQDPIVSCIKLETPSAPLRSMANVCLVVGGPGLYGYPEAAQLDANNGWVMDTRYLGSVNQVAIPFWTQAVGLAVAPFNQTQWPAARTMGEEAMVNEGLIRKFAGMVGPTEMARCVSYALDLHFRVVNSFTTTVQPTLANTGENISKVATYQVNAQDRDNYSQGGATSLAAWMSVGGHTTLTGWMPNHVTGLTIATGGDPAWYSGAQWDVAHQAPRNYGVSAKLDPRFMVMAMSNRIVLAGEDPAKPNLAMLEKLGLFQELGRMRLQVAAGLSALSAQMWCVETGVPLAWLSEDVVYGANLNAAAPYLVQLATSRHAGSGLRNVDYVRNMLASRVLATHAQVLGVSLDMVARTYPPMAVGFLAQGCAPGPVWGDVFEASGKSYMVPFAPASCRALEAYTLQLTEFWDWKERVAWAGVDLCSAAWRVDTNSPADQPALAGRRLREMTAKERIGLGSLLEAQQEVQVVPVLRSGVAHWNAPFRVDFTLGQAHMVVRGRWDLSTLDSTDVITWTVNWQNAGGAMGPGPVPGVDYAATDTDGVKSWGAAFTVGLDARVTWYNQTSTNQIYTQLADSVTLQPSDAPVARVPLAADTETDMGAFFA